MPVSSNQVITLAFTCVVSVLLTIIVINAQNKNATQPVQAQPQTAEITTSQTVVVGEGGVKDTIIRTTFKEEDITLFEIRRTYGEARSAKRCFMVHKQNNGPALALDCD